MMPLEVTHTAVAGPEILKALEEYKSPIGKCLLELIKVFQVNYKKSQNFDYPPIHDPTAVYYLL